MSLLIKTLGRGFRSKHRWVALDWDSTVHVGRVNHFPDVKKPALGQAVENVSELNPYGSHPLPVEALSFLGA